MSVKKFVNLLMETEMLTESQVINLSNKAYKSLSDKAKNAIDAWERSMWTDGPLERHVKANDEIAQEIHNAIQPAIRAIGKNKIRLYRGIQYSEGGDEYAAKKFLESWTLSKSMAEYFAGRATLSGNSRLKTPLTIEQIKKAVHQLETKGAVRVGHLAYIKPKEEIEWPEGWEPKGTYYKIYDGKEFVTDGDDLESSLMDDREWALEWNETLLKNSEVFEENIDVSRIVWITNNLKSLEFIIRK